MYLRGIEEFYKLIFGIDFYLIFFLETIQALLNKTDKLHPDFKLLNEALNTIVSVIK